MDATIMTARPMSGIMFDGMHPRFASLERGANAVISHAMPYEVRGETDG